jgi:hypothetical protein
MTVVLSPASVQTGQNPARNVRGHLSGLAPAATGTLLSQVVGTRRLRGLSVHGTTDGLAWVEVDGEALDGLVARFSRVLPAFLLLPNPEEYPGEGSVVVLKVRNESGDAITGVSGSYEGTLFGE